MSLGLLAIIGSIITAIPAKAADNVYFYYGPAQFSVSVDSISKFAYTGEIQPDLSLYLKDASPQQVEKFRQILLLKSPSTPFQVFRFFNHPVGEVLLDRIGDLINSPGGINGKFALRAAMIDASQDPEGLTLLNLLRKYPTDIELNTSEISKQSDSLELIFELTKLSIAAISQLSN